MCEQIVVVSLALVSRRGPLSVNSITSARPTSNRKASQRLLGTARADPQSPPTLGITDMLERNALRCECPVHNHVKQFHRKQSPYRVLYLSNHKANVLFQYILEHALVRTARMHIWLHDGFEQGLLYACDLVGRVHEENSWAGEQGLDFLVDVVEEAVTEISVGGSDCNKEVQGFWCGGGAKKVEKKFRYLDAFVSVLEFSRWNINAPSTIRFCVL